MPRQMPMRQYTNQSQSGTITKGGMRKDPNEKLLVSKKPLRNLKSERDQVEDYTAPSIVKDAKAPKTRSARRRKPSAALAKEVEKLTETTTETTED